MKRPPVLLIEYNELTMSLIERFMAAGSLPNFRAFFDRSTVYETTAGEDPLEPWIQWPTIHCGVPYAVHGARHLGDGRTIRQKAVGTVLSEAGLPVGIFGTINANYARGVHGYVVPDPWAPATTVSPASLRPFFDFVALQVQENTKGLQMTPRTLASFVWFMLRHGLSLATLRAGVAQVLRELRNREISWRRPAILDLLQYDVFRHLNARHTPRFASFFSNSTAHLQHYYWRNMNPQGFEEAPAADADPSLSDAVAYGYRAMDRLLGRIVRDHPEHRLMLCTGLSQQPWYDTTKCTYRPIDFSAFLAFAGVTEEASVEPVMAERFRVRCARAADAQSVARTLGAMRFRDAPLMRVEVASDSILTGCGIFEPGEAFFSEVVTAGGRTRTFGELFTPSVSMNSGKHHASGSLWIRDGRHRVVPGAIPLTAIAPTLLHHFEVAIPASMDASLVLVDA